MLLHPTELDRPLRLLFSGDRISARSRNSLFNTRCDTIQIHRYTLAKYLLQFGLEKELLFVYISSFMYLDF